MLKKPWLRIDFFAAAFLSVLSAGLTVALAFFLMQIVDAAVEGDWSQLIFSLILTIAIAVGELIINPTSRFFGYKYIKHNLVLSKNTLFKNTLKGFRKGINEDIAKYSTDVNILYDNFYINHVLMVRAATLFVFSVAGVIFIDWRLFLAVLVSSLLPMIAPGFFTKKISKAVERYSKKSKNYIDYVNDSFEGIYEIKSFHAQGHFVKVHNKLNNEAEKARISNKMINFILHSTSNFLGSFVFISIIGVGGFLTIQGIVTIGALIAVVQLLNGIVSPIGEIATLIGEIKGAKNLAESYFDEPETKSDGININEFKTNIKVDNISFTYPQSNVSVLNNFSVSFAKGKTYAIIGESGCGKSTFAKILAGVLCNDSGNIFIDNININGINMDSYSKKVKYVHQHTHLFDMPIKENIELGSSNVNIKKYINDLGISEIYSKRSEDEEISNREGVSGGQKQRIALARALNNKPDILILDEPTANLDLESAKSIIKYLKGIEDLTLIIITHADNPDIIEMFDDVIEMKSLHV